MQTKNGINLTDKNPTACVLIIGNELLSGQIRDENLPFLAARLHERGIDLIEVRFIRDQPEAIVQALRDVHPLYTYIFTTGGIGPTHDDITASSIATAFHKPLVCSIEAYRRMRQKYPHSKAPHALARMSMVPEGASLIINPLSAAPGFKLYNIHVLAGVPNIMRAMFEELAPSLIGGRARHCQEIIINTVEGLLSQGLEGLQEQYKETEIGSYPIWSDHSSHQVRVVIKGFEEKDVRAVAQKITALAHVLEQNHTV